jgi:hypothetical protein
MHRQEGLAGDSFCEARTVGVGGFVVHADARRRSAETSLHLATATSVMGVYQILTVGSFSHIR